MKYVDVEVTLSEVPDEIALCINISNCPCHCEGCHSSYLAEDIGKILNEESLKHLVDTNDGISCVSFMGGDSEPNEVQRLASFVKKNYPDLKVAWYSGRPNLYPELDYEPFDYVKIGPYIPEFGPLNSPTTNQKFFKLEHHKGCLVSYNDITSSFLKLPDYV